MTGFRREAPIIRLETLIGNGRNDEVFNIYATPFHSYPPAPRARPPPAAPPVARPPARTARFAGQHRVFPAARQLGAEPAAARPCPAPSLRAHHRAARHS